MHITFAGHSTAGKSFTVPEFQASGSQAVLPWMGALFASVAGLVLLWQKAVPQQRAVGLEEIVAQQEAADLFPSAGAGWRDVWEWLNGSPGNPHRAP